MALHPPARPLHRTRDNWLLVALVIAECLFGAALVAYLVGPAMTTLTSSSPEAWAR